MVRAALIAVCIASIVSVFASLLITQQKGGEPTLTLLLKKGERYGDLEVLSESSDGEVQTQIDPSRDALAELLSSVKTESTVVRLNIAPGVQQDDLESVYSLLKEVGTSSITIQLLPLEETS